MRSIYFELPSLKSLRNWKPPGSSCRDFTFPSEVLRTAHERTTAQLAFSVHKLCTRMLALLPYKTSTNAVTTPQDNPPTAGTPPRMDHTETEVPFRSPATPEALSAQATALWHRDYCFATDTSHIDKILRQAQEPISFDIDPSNPEDMDPCLDLDCELLATLDPATRSNVLRLAHELRSTDVLLAQATMKLELMDSNAYIAKIVRAKSKLKPPADFLKDPKFIALNSEFEDLIRKYQTDGTAIVRRLVNHQVTVYRENIVPQLIQGLFYISKQAVVGRRPQNNILGILQMAQKKVNLPDLPETNEQVAGYTLLLLLASPCAHVLCSYIGLPSDSLPLLFTKTLAMIKDCPKPQRSRKRNETTTDQTEPHLPLVPPLDPALVTPVHTSTADSRPKISAPTVDASVFRTARSLLLGTNTNTFMSASTPQSNDGFSTFLTTSATTAGPPRTAAATPTGPSTKTSETPLSPPATQRTTATTVLIGNELFDMPSPACWALAMELHQALMPIANHITMVQRLQLARKLTRSKVITATRGLKIKRDVFTATTSVRELIDKIDAEPHQVISIINGWHRQTFRTMEKLLQKRLLQINSKNEMTTTRLPAATNPATRSNSPPVIDLQDTPPQPRTARFSPPGGDNRKRSAWSAPAASDANSRGKRQKNGKDGSSPAASSQTSNSKQSTNSGATSSQPKQTPPPHQNSAHHTPGATSSTQKKMPPNSANSSARKKMPPTGANSSSRKQMPPSGANSSTRKKMPPTAPKHVRQVNTSNANKETPNVESPGATAGATSSATATSATKRRNRNRGKKRKTTQQTKAATQQFDATAHD